MRAGSAFVDEVARCTVPAIRVVEKREATRLLLAERRFAVQDLVELAVEGLEAGIVELKPLERLAQRRERVSRARANILAEHFAETCCVSTLAQLGRDVGGVRVGHLVGVQ